MVLTPHYIGEASDPSFRFLRTLFPAARFLTHHFLHNLPRSAHHNAEETNPSNKKERELIMCDNRKNSKNNQNNQQNAKNQQNKNGRNVKNQQGTNSKNQQEQQF